ncbi:hypothetical protein DWG88_00285 [Escherichia coli]|nr:hypothetical protein [Escherichia coli]EFO1473096.1 hypothetical protein [Escherichia coli]
MLRERLIRPTDPAPIVGLIRCAGIAAGIVRQLPDAAGTPYPAYRSGTNCRPDKMRRHRSRHRAPIAGCGGNALSGLPIRHQL